MSKSCKSFDSAEEVWFCGCVLARGDGLRGRGDYSGEERNVEVSDIYRIIKKMKLAHQIDNRSLRVLTKWGCLGCPPYYDKRAKNSEIKLWDTSIHSFEEVLKNKRIIK